MSLTLLSLVHPPLDEHGYGIGITKADPKGYPVSRVWTGVDCTTVLLPEQCT